MITQSDLTLMLEDYAAFEMRVNELMQSACAPFCRVCKNPCCRIEICREAAESPFLQAVQNLPSLKKSSFDRKSGYLTCTGCTLKAGRPPICHSFVCSLIITSQPSDQHRYALECLGDLVTYIGAKVWLKRHLVETVIDADLQKINIEKFRIRFSQASAALEVLTPFFRLGLPLENGALGILRIIRKPDF